MQITPVVPMYIGSQFLPSVPFYEMEMCEKAKKEIAAHAQPKISEGQLLCLLIQLSKKPSTQITICNFNNKGKAVFINSLD